MPILDFSGEVVAALLGALIGATAPIAVNWIHECRHERRLARHASLSIAGEVTAIADIVRRRDYINGVRAAEKSAREGTPYPLRIRVTHSFFPVTEASLPHLGILPAELPLLIPRLLTLIKAALEDIQAVEAGHWDHRDALAFADGYKELGDLLEEAMAAGRDIVSIVERHYPSHM